MMDIKSKLLDEILNCPDVEWKPLDLIVDVITAPSKVKKEIYKSNGTIPIIDQGERFIAGYTSENLKPVKADDYIIFGDHSEHIKYVNFAFIQGADGIKILKPKNDIAKFIYYAFQCFYQKELSYKRHWTKAKETLIPIPPLPIQQKIVDILDKFTKLTAELTAELTARKQQYEYYRDELLTFGDDVELSTIDDIFHLKNGYTPSKSKVEYWSNGNIPWFRMEDLRLNGGILDTAIQHVHESGIKGELFPANSIIMATTATIGIHALITKEHLSNQQFTNFTVKEKYKSLLNIKFVYYYFFILDEKAKKSVNTSSFACVQMNEFRKWNFPIPSLKEQARIVEILDKFDALTNSITEGLPREIELRQQQYEYYRDLLLSFPKPDGVK